MSMHLERLISDLSLPLFNISAVTGDDFDLQFKVELLSFSFGSCFLQRILGKL